jgi:hypothetical protein
MNWYRWLGCALLLGVADAAWLYLLLGLLGFVAGMGHAPLSWLIATAILLMGTVSRAVRELIPAGWRLRQALLPCVATPVVWLGVSSGSALHGARLGLSWPLDLAQAGFDWSLCMAVVLSLVVVGLLWQRGDRRGRGVNGGLDFARSVRTGLVVFTLLLAFEALGNLDLGTRIATGPFFIASLLGMALARAPVHGIKLHLWLGLLMGAIVTTLTMGLAVSLLVVAVVRGGFSAVHDVWRELAYAVRRSVSDTLVELLGERDTSDINASAIAWEPSQGLMLMVVVLGAILFAPLIYRVLKAPRPLTQPNVMLDLGSAAHEPIAGSDVDLAEPLLEKLRSFWPWRREQQGAPSALPGNPELARIYRLSYLLLERARARGATVNSAHTPRERVVSLSAVNPAWPVAPITAVFEAPCYGRRSPLPHELDRLSAQLESDVGSSNIG